MTSSSRDLPSDLPFFDGFPYLSIRVASGMYHIILLPAGLPETDLVEAARRQVLANRLPVCLVLAHDRAIYFDPEGGRRASHEPPRGGYLVAEGLAPAMDPADPTSKDFRTRQRRLARMVARGRRRGGYLLGDLTKGGRPATDEEKQSLAGVLDDGVPRGLTRCDACGDWKGVCLDPSAHFADQVMTVYCHCDNHNRCARCHERLYERRLNANFYNPVDRRVWHVPGFIGLNHRCSAENYANRAREG